MVSTKVAVSQTAINSPNEAGIHLSKSIKEKLNGAKPDVLIVFASPEFPYKTLLESLNQECQPGILIGCSSAGEFSGCSTGNSSVSVMAIQSDSILFNAALGKGLRTNRTQAIKEIEPVFTASEHPEYPYRCALVLTDALAGYADDLIHELTVQTGGSYQLFGGGAADDARFHETHVFFGAEAYGDAVLVLEMLSKKPIGIGVKHGWRTAGNALRVTEVEQNRIMSLNAMPAVEAFEEHAKQTGQTFNRKDPMPFFLHNVIGIDAGDGEYKLRVPLALNDDGSITCAAEVPAGSTVHIMVGSAETACDAAREASKAAIAGLNGEKHAGSLLFDCAATRLRLGREFQDELQAVADTLGSENFAGCNTYGQIARTEGQFSGFHNCTAIVCAIPQ